MSKGKEEILGMLKREIKELRRKAKIRVERWEKEKKKMREYITELEDSNSKAKRK